MSRPTLPPALWREAVWRWALRSQRRQDRRESLLLTHRGLRDMLRLSQRRVYMPMPMPTPRMPAWFNDPSLADDSDLASLGHIGHLGDLSNNMQWRMPGLRYTERLPTSPSWAAARGWCVAALLLAAALLLVRLADRCLRSRRRTVVEWPTPDVLATSNRGSDLWVDSDPDVPDPYSDSSEAASNDFPPPYSQCSAPGAEPKPPSYSDEPPPPYSACYVAFSRPKDESYPAVRSSNDHNGVAHSTLGNAGTVNVNRLAIDDACMNIEDDVTAKIPSDDALRENVSLAIDDDCLNIVDEVTLRIPSDDNALRENVSVAI